MVIKSGSGYCRLSWCAYPKKGNPYTYSQLLNGNEKLGMRPRKDSFQTIIITLFESHHKRAIKIQIVCSKLLCY